MEDQTRQLTVLVLSGIMEPIVSQVHLIRVTSLSSFIAFPNLSPGPDLFDYVHPPEPYSHFVPELLRFICFPFWIPYSSWDDSLFRRKLVCSSLHVTIELGVPWRPLFSLSLSPLTVVPLKCTRARYCLCCPRLPKRRVNIELPDWKMTRPSLAAPGVTPCPSYAEKTNNNREENENADT